jgi:hypothetical protein
MIDQLKRIVEIIFIHKETFMLYIGYPFNKFSEITEEDIRHNSAYFIKKDIDSPLFSAVFERISNNKIILVYYQITSQNTFELIEFHKKNYGPVSMFIENPIDTYVFKITTLSEESKITGSIITLYDELWRTSIEQFFDERNLLSEYRKCFYNDNERVPFKEKIFFNSWHISEERYG